MKSDCYPVHAQNAMRHGLTIGTIVQTCVLYAHKIAIANGALYSVSTKNHLIICHLNVIFYYS